MAAKRGTNVIQKFNIDPLFGSMLSVKQRALFNVMVIYFYRHTSTPSVVLLLSSSFKGMLSHFLVHLDLPVYSRIDEWVTF